MNIYHFMNIERNVNVMTLIGVTRIIVSIHSVWWPQILFENQHQQFVITKSYFDSNSISISMVHLDVNE